MTQHCRQWSGVGRGVSCLGLMGLLLVASSSWVLAGERVQVPDHWMVAGGVGGCSAVTSIDGDLRDLKPWQGPEDFVNGLREKGLQVSTVTGEYQGRYMVKVLVPARGVDVVFVPYSLCRIMWQEELDRYARTKTKPK